MECGACTYCCLLPEVPELQKPVNKWCQHCKHDTGCLIYGERPASCRQFECMWKSAGLGEELRPDRCKVMFEQLPDCRTCIAITHPHAPDAWKKHSVQAYMGSILMAGCSIAVNPGPDRKKIILLAQGQIQEGVYGDIVRAYKLSRGEDGSTVIHN